LTTSVADAAADEHLNTAGIVSVGGTPSSGSAIIHYAGTSRGRPYTSTLTHTPTTAAIHTISNVFTTTVFSNHSAGSQWLLLISCVNREVESPSVNENMDKIYTGLVDAFLEEFPANQ